MAATLLVWFAVSCTGNRQVIRPDKQMVGPQSFEVYDRDWNLQGHVKKGAFTNRYYIYDKQWNVRGYIKWNSFSKRYELYDKDWKKKGYLEADGGLLPFLKERR